MASFQAKVGWKSPRKKENKNFRSISFHSRRVIENSKKIGKNFKELKNTIMASFQAKVGWKSPRKEENKNSRSISFLPGA